MKKFDMALSSMLTAFGFLAGAATHAETPIGTMEGIAIILPEDFICSQNVSVMLKADSNDPFSDRELMQRMAGQLSALMAFECSAAENIKMDGVVGNKIIYSAITSKGSNWAVLERMTPIRNEGSSLANNISSPGDGGSFPVLPSTGISPTVPSETSPQPMATSENKAMDRLRQIGSQNGDALSGEITKEVDFSGYNKPNILDAFYNGDPEPLRESNDALLYVNGFNRFFSSTVNFIDQSCAHLYKPSLDRDTLTVIYGDMVGTGSVEEQGLNALTQMGSMLLDLQAGGPEVLMNRVGEIDILQQSGEKDAARLADTLNCKHPAVRRIYDNMAAYVSGKPMEASAKVAHQNRIHAAKIDISSKCEERFANEAFCSCLMNSLEETAISAETWDAIGADLANLVFVSSDPSQARNLVRSCSH